MSKDHPYYRAYCDHRDNARWRGSGGVPFNLTFEQWLTIWQDSGHLPNRGHGGDKYCMARNGDRGAYEVGNVKIITNRENAREGAQRDRSWRSPVSKKPAKTIEDAVKLFKSERALADACGYSQHAIWKARTNRLRQGISPKMALAIDKATKGRVKACELLPELF